MSRITITLAPDEFAALADLAAREWREPRHQAGLLVVNGLRQAGVLPEPPSAEPEPADRDPVEAAS